MAQVNRRGKPCQKPPLQTLIDLFSALKLLPRGEAAARSALFRTYSAYGSERTLQRHLVQQFGRRRERRSDAGTVSPVTEQIAELVAEKKIQAFALSGRWISTENAVKNLQSAGKVTGSNLPSVTAINHAIRAQNLLEVRHSYDVLHAQAAHDLHVADTSGSLVFRTVEFADDPVVETCPALDSSTFKNHPENTGRRQVFLFGMVDSHSGYLWAQYMALPGPSSWAMAGFLLESWRNSCVPKHFLTDHGKENAGAVEHLITALGVNRLRTKPRNPNGRGIVERAWRTIWQSFETPLILAQGVGKRYSLSTLNGMLREYLANDYNAKPARLAIRSASMSRYVSALQRRSSAPGRKSG